MPKITYEDKKAIYNDENIPVTGKVTDEDMNEIKKVVNTIDDILQTYNGYVYREVPELPEEGQRGIVYLVKKEKEENTFSIYLWSENKWVPLGDTKLFVDPSIVVDINCHKYYKNVDEKVLANSEIELPCYYKVGSDVLDVYYLGELLIKDDEEKGIEGHYQEVGEIGEISNKIIVGWDVDAQTEEDDSYFEFVVRGEYEGGDA